MSVKRWSERRQREIWVASLIYLPLLLACQAALAAAAAPDPPEVVFQDLYVAVESARLFPDSKQFPDAVPKSAPQDILALYHSQRPRSPQELRKFVEAHFLLPQAAAAAPAVSEHVPIGRHIDSLWEQLTRSTVVAPPYSSLLPLPRPYVVPGGRFREVYYWDSYFTMLGLLESRRRDLVEDMVADFAALIDTFGHIPNGARSYYVSRSQPPFFFEMVALLSASEAAQALASYLPQLKKEYAFWMDGAAGLTPGGSHRRVVALEDGSILNRYWDDRDTPRDEAYWEDTTLARTSRREPAQLYRDIRAAAESGWDFSSRWLADSRTLATIDTTEIIPVDLNSLLFGLESAIQAGCERAGDRDCAREFAQRGAARRTAIDRYLWDAASGAYLDYRWTRKERIAHLTAATLYPLFLQVANDRQASSVAKAVEKRLLKPGGIVTTTLTSGQQWDAPNGWAPLQWIALTGLSRYGQTRLAEQIACRWMANVSRVYRETGKLVEKYDVTAPNRPGGGGEYPLQDGFGWTNGVMRRLMALYPAYADYGSVDQCAGKPRSRLGKAPSASGSNRHGSDRHQD